MAKAPEDSKYLYVGVGDRTFWKDQNNIFRTAKETQLKRFGRVLIIQSFLN